MIFRERFGDDVNTLSILFQATVAAGDAEKAAELLDHMKERNMQLPRALSLGPRFGCSPFSGMCTHSQLHVTSLASKAGRTIHLMLF